MQIITSPHQIKPGMVGIDPRTKKRFLIVAESTVPPFDPGLIADYFEHKLNWNIRNNKYYAQFEGEPDAKLCCFNPDISELQIDWFTGDALPQTPPPPP